MRFRDSFHPYAMTTIFFWSLAYVFTRLALGHFSPFPLGFLRYFAASCALLTVVLATHMKLPARKDAVWFLLAGATGFFFYMLTFNTGSRTVTASTSSVVIATTPIITALLARLFYREKLTAVQYAAIAVSFLGVVVLTALRGGFSVSLGVLYLLAAAVSLSFYNLIQRRLTKTYPALQSAAFSIFCGTAMLAVFLPGSVTELKTAPPAQVGYILILGILSSAAAYCAWAKAFSKAKSTSSVSNYMFATPFLTTLLALAIAGEPVERPTVLGGLIIIAGLLLFHFGEGLLRKAGAETGGHGGRP